MIYDSLANFQSPSHSHNRCSSFSPRLDALERWPGEQDAHWIGQYTGHRIWEHQAAADIASFVFFMNSMYCLLNVSNWMSLILPEPDLSPENYILYYTISIPTVLYFLRVHLLYVYSLRLVVECFEWSLIKYSVNADIFS